MVKHRLAADDDIPLALGAMAIVFVLMLVGYAL